MNQQPADLAAIAHRAAYHACYADAYARAIQTGGTIARCRANAEYEATNAAARAVAAIVEDGGEA